MKIPHTRTYGMNQEGSFYYVIFIYIANAYVKKIRLSRLSGSEHWLLLQRTGVQFPEHVVAHDHV